MADTDSAEHDAVLKIQRIQRGKAARVEKMNKDKAAAKIQSIQRGKAVRIEQKIKETTQENIQSVPELNIEGLDDEPQSNGFDDSRGTNFGCETRQTDFGSADQHDVRSAETINNTQIEKFSTFTKKDGHFTGNYPETTEALLSSPRQPTALQQAQEDLVVTVGQKQHKSVRSNYQFCKWYARKSNGVSHHTTSLRCECICLPFMS